MNHNPLPCLPPPTQVLATGEQLLAAAGEAVQLAALAALPPSGLACASSSGSLSTEDGCCGDLKAAARAGASAAVLQGPLDGPPACQLRAVLLELPTQELQPSGCEEAAGVAQSLGRPGMEGSNDAAAGFESPTMRPFARSRLTSDHPTPQSPCPDDDDGGGERGAC